VVYVIQFCWQLPSWSRSQAVGKPVWHMPLLRVQWKTPDDGQRNCPKHAEFYSKNKFEKLMHLVGFIIWIYHDARSSESQICLVSVFPSNSSNPSWAPDVGCISHLFDRVCSVSFLGPVVIAFTGVHSQENMHEEWLLNDSLMSANWHVLICISQNQVTSKNYCEP